MNPIVKNIIAVILGAVIGGVVNGIIITISPMLIPPPAGADVTTVEGLKASIHLFGPENYIMPFLAHALGTLVGAIIAALLAANNRMKLAMLVAALFLVGGIMNVFMLPAAVWFCILDLAAAYLPMGWLGYKIATMIKPE